MRTSWAMVWTMLRQGLPALALYALVLQAFLTGAAPAAAFHPENAPLCAEMSAGTHAPTPEQSHPDCLCLAQCLQAHAQTGLTPSSGASILPREGQTFGHAAWPRILVVLHPLERGQGARAPPRA